MIRVRRMRDGEMKVSEGTDALREALASPEPDWISLVAPTQEEIDAVCGEIDLHPLAMRDALRERQPPKIEDFGDYLFFIVQTPVERAFSQTRRVSVFLAKQWVVSVQTTESDAMDEIAKRVEQAPEHLLQSPDALAHVIIDHMTAGFEDLTASILEEMTQLEDRVLGDASPASMEAILKMRRKVIGLARVTRAQRDVCASLCRMPHDCVRQEMMPYLRDVYDHILRVFELLESAREGLQVTRDAYLAVVNNRLSEIMRTLTIIATIMMPATLLAGIYGMNVPIPGQDSAIGFWFVLGLMAILMGVMLVYFRRKKWF